MLLCGHTGTITCLDLHGNHLVSGARDCKVKGKSVKSTFNKPGHLPVSSHNIYFHTWHLCNMSVSVWNLQTGQCCDRMKFRHRNPVVCVKADSSLVLSGCEGGLIKMWDMETATLLKVR